jgi:hypothetical protein
MHVYMYSNAVDLSRVRVGVISRYRKYHLQCISARSMFLVVYGCTERCV